MLRRRVAQSCLHARALHLHATHVGHAVAHRLRPDDEERRAFHHRLPFAHAYFGDRALAGRANRVRTPLRHEHEGTRHRFRHRHDNRGERDDREERDQYRGQAARDPVRRLGVEERRIDVQVWTEWRCHALTSPTAG